MDPIYNLADINPAVQKWINQERRKGHNVTQQEIDRYKGELLVKRYDTPNPDLHGFTPSQFDDMTYTPLEEGCPVQLRTLTEDELSQIPIMRQVLHLMNSLAEKEIKLTLTGSLPLKMVEELYDLGVKSKYSDMYKKDGKLREQRCEEVIVVRNALEGAGLIKKRLGKLSLTAKGKKLLKNHNELLKYFLIYLFSDFDTGCLDNYNTMDGLSGNVGQLYSLWLLHHYGSEWRRLILYASDYYWAYDDIMGEGDAYTVRIFEGLFRIIGLCEIQDNKVFLDSHRYYREEEVRKTPLVDMIFSFEEPAKI